MSKSCVYRERTLPPPRCAFPLERLEEGLVVERDVAPLPAHAGVEVALQRRVVVRRGFPVAPEAQLPLPPLVEVVVRPVEHGVAVEELPVDPVGERLVDLAAVAEAREPALLDTRAGRGVDALRVLRAPGDDVDHPVHRVGAVDRAARAADHLDAVDVLEERVLHLPVRAGEERRVDRAAVDQHEDRAREPAREAADADRPLVRVDARHLHARGEAERVRDRGDARAADVLARDHVDRRRHLRPLLGFPRDGGRLDVHELFEREVGEAPAALAEPRRAGRRRRSVIRGRRRHARARGRARRLIRGEDHRARGEHEEEKARETVDQGGPVEKTVARRFTPFSSEWTKAP